MQYMDYIQGKQSEALQVMEQTLGRAVGALYSYRAAYNGMAVDMSPAEAGRVAQLPEVAAVIPDRMRQLHTDNGPSWIGADDIWGGLVSDITRGEGIVIGVIDTGINPANPSFADIGGDGYDHANPRGRYYGFCDSGDPYYNAGFCNDKLIGAYDLTVADGDPPVLYDNDGHGSHTASTAAGNVIDPATVVAPTITINRPISGVAPHSNIIAYKACLATGCPLSSLLAAIDQATLDGVDVINYSIGGSAADPWNDADSEAFLNARQAGVFVATSAGNSGPGRETLGSPGNSPWLLTVGSSSHDRSFGNSLINLTSTGGYPLADIAGKSLTGALPARSILYAGNYGDALCLSPFAAGTFSGQIVICDRGTNARVDKGANVLAGGAGGMVLANDAANGDSLNSDAHVLPAVHITYDDGAALKAWLVAGTGHQAAISASTAKENAAYGDIMSSFSSRGANLPVPSVIKPDVSAPGQDILAANGTDNAATWGMMSGTSMSSPHAAGAAALLLALHPDWSPAEIQSALMTAADPTVLKEDGLTAADPFDTGTGRINVSAAASAGFILDETHSGYIAADPALGGDPKSLNIPSLGSDNFVQSTTWYRTVTATTNTSWTAAVTNPPGVALAVSPAAFSLTAGQTQQLAVTANAAGAAVDTWLFGAVTLTPASGDTAAARLPVAIKRTVSNLPQAVRYDKVSQRADAILNDLEVLPAITELTINTHGLTAPAMHTADLYQDPTPADPFDGNWATDDPANKDGLWVQLVAVPAGSKRLVTEIVQSDSPDMDMYLYRLTGSAWEWHCTSAGDGSSEYCSVADPPAGDYYVWIHNYAARDPSGATPDNVQLAAAVVSGASAGNLSVSLAGGGSAVPAGQPFDLMLSWNLPKTQAYWYGRFGLGTDVAHPDNLGLIDLDIHLEFTGMFVPVMGTDGKMSIIYLQ